MKYKPLPIYVVVLLAILSLCGCAVGKQTAPEPEPPILLPEETPQPTPSAPYIQEPDVLLPVGFFPAEDAAALSPSRPDAVRIEDELLALINEARSAENVAMLQSDETLLQAARIRAGELQRSYSDIRPDRKDFYTVFDEIGFSYSKRWYGENISRLEFTQNAYTEAEIAKAMFDELSKSTGHKNNMLRSQYDMVGVGVYVATDDSTVKVTSSQIFTSQQAG
ncbi:CAP domain-containing protein [Ruminococcaceae bacterium OttesenSCG-928-L11]|nr:CAP domain-containing protein [Ruminococcaceae bacterium OttesenSCG-928-L11]